MIAPGMRYSLDWLTPGIERVQARHQRRVADLYAGRPPGDVIAIAGASYGHSHGLAGTADIDMLARPDDWLADVFDDMASRAGLAADPVTFRPLTIEPDAYGVHYIDALFGAQVYVHGGQTWSDELAGDVDGLAMPDLERSPILQASLRLARLAVEAGQGRVFVTTPVLSCPVNIAINLLGERWLEALAERPAAAGRALRIIADVILACARAFYGVIPEDIRRGTVALNRYAPPGHGFIDGCSTQLVSARHYREWIAPLDAEILELSPRGGMIHLCGAHAQHIPAWRAMPCLRSVQVNDRATDDLPRYLAGLRDDQILYVAPTAATPVERVMQLAENRPLILQCELSHPLPRGAW
jgi:hypothetical protein